MLPSDVRPPRLQRLDKLFVHSPLYFLTFCTHRRAALLATPHVHASFVAFCRHAIGRGVHVGRYVLMPDHVHFFVSISDDGATLSAWIKSLKNSLSKTLRAHDHPSPHWQKGFFDHVTRSSDSYSEKWDYVRDNPVRAGLAATPDAWPYQGTIHDLRF